MFRNHYDTDVTTWSPAGRLHQVEYAMEAVKQGSATVGVKSKNHVVLVSLKRALHSELSSYQNKLFKIDSHIGISIAGLTADARVLSKFMRAQCLNHRYVFESPIAPGRLVHRVADKSQKGTQGGSKRPFGVGLLVSGYTKENGPQLFQTCPSGNFYEYKGIAIGARSQAARTYIEKHYEEFPDANLEDLVLHALRALDATTGDNIELTEDNTSISIIGSDFPSNFFASTDESRVDSPFKDGVPRTGEYTLYDGEGEITNPKYIVLERALQRLNKSKSGQNEQSRDEMVDE